MRQERVGSVSHYYGHIHVAGVVLEKDVRVGDTIHVKGHTSDFTQKVDSIEMEHKSLIEAHRGDDVGLKVAEHCRQHDVVYKIVEE